MHKLKTLLEFTISIFRKPNGFLAATIEENLKVLCRTRQQSVSLTFPSRTPLGGYVLLTKKRRVRKERYFSGSLRFHGIINDKKEGFYLGHIIIGNRLGYV